MTPEQRSLWRFYYQRQLDFAAHYKGVPIVKNPLDLWVYGEIIHETKPDVIIETGSFQGGSAIWLADQFDGQVLSVDLESNRKLPRHERVKFHTGLSSTDPEVIVWLRRNINGRCMVILDSDHSQDHVLEELDLYAPLVSVGCFLIVEDTNPFAYNGPAGPERALRLWQPVNKGFEPEKSRERYVLTCHPGGFLRRVR